MLALRDEMLAAGLPMTHGIRLALLHTYAGEQGPWRAIGDRRGAAGRAARRSK